MNENNLPQKFYQNLENSIDSWCEAKPNSKVFNSQTNNKLVNAPIITQKKRLNLSDDYYLNSYFLGKSEIMDTSITEDDVSEEDSYCVEPEGVIPSCNLSIETHSKNDLDLSDLELTYAKNSNLGNLWKKKTEHNNDDKDNLDLE